ncbi:uncharacterized protein LOC130793294 [Actinidia eriantha]|uniref:uncharacterized protein LOC130793294 n=1 Tax=Actinidia eriantha TaxID=165200 RepID=UPI00258C337E|nr:uncharacterized protein LOC130793294 [Actinidia eriantha]
MAHSKTFLLLGLLVALMLILSRVSARELVEEGQTMEMDNLEEKHGLGHGDLHHHQNHYHHHHHGHHGHKHHHHHLAHPPKQGKHGHHGHGLNEASDETF